MAAALRREHDGRRHRAEGDAHGVAAHAGHHHLRDRLRPPRAHLAPPLPAVDRRESRSPRSARRAGGRWRDSPCRSSTNGTRAFAAWRSAARPRHRRPPAPAACRRPATRWRCCRRACRDSGSARRRSRGRGDEHRHPRVHQARGEDLRVGRQRAEAQAAGDRSRCRAARRGPRDRGTLRLRPCRTAGRRRRRCSRRSASAVRRPAAAAPRRGAAAPASGGQRARARVTVLAWLAGGSRAAAGVLDGAEDAG